MGTPLSRGSSYISSPVEADHYHPNLNQSKTAPACLDVSLLSINSQRDTASNRGEDLSFSGWSAALSVRGWLDCLN